MSLIILEGPSKAGKSTLAKNLSQILGIPVSHFSQPIDNDDAFEMYKEFAIDLLDSRTEAIADRLHLGEFVFGPLKRGYYPKPDFMKKIESYLKQIPTLLVLVETPQYVLETRFRKERESFEKISELPTIIHSFRDAYELSTLPKMIVNGTTNPLINATNIILRLEEILNG